MTYDPELGYDPDDFTPEQLAEIEAIPPDFEFIIDDDEPEPAPRISKAAAQRVLAHRVMSVASLRALPPVDWFVDHLVPAGPRTLLHGPGGSKKSFLVLDWMLCAATGEPWHGRPVAPGRVLYIIGEGVSGTAKRIDAWLSQHPDVDPDLPGVYFMPVTINLHELSKDHAALWNELVVAMNFKYIVVDTIHQSMAGGEENSATDIGKVLANASAIAGPDANLILVHHDPKQGDGTKIASPRGSSALRDSVDVCLTMVPDKDSNLVSVLRPDKVRDAEPFEPLHLRFAIFGQRGEASSSLYIASVDDGKPTGELAERLDRSEEQRRVIAFLRDKRRRSTTFTSKTQIAIAVGGRRAAMLKAVDELMADGMLVTIDGELRLAPSPS